MTSDKSIWAELRAEGQWLELWADMRATGTVQDMLELKRSMTPEECSADNAAREAMADTPEFRAALDAIAERPLTRILDRIEAIEGKEQRELAEAGRKLALAGRRAKRLQQETFDYDDATRRTVSEKRHQPRRPRLRVRVAPGTYASPATPSGNSHPCSILRLSGGLQARVSYPAPILMT